MRLIRPDNEGGLDLVEHYTDIPPFAILSHTWGDLSQEVLYKDLLDGAYESKVGYQKVLFCQKQAGQDQLSHFWIDSICIDKHSSVELSEAINSMYRWYKQAEVCYVYLSDVSTSGLILPDERAWPQSLRDQFCRSRWFTRGWTLQELLAPSTVKFFSREGLYLGDKVSLESLISFATGIDARALQGAPLDQFSVQKRLSWAKGRRTTRPEDMAYSLLGLFGICMPLLYGEGNEAAMDRLLRKIKKRNKRSPFSRIRAWLSLHKSNLRFPPGAHTIGPRLRTSQLQCLPR